jgi:arylsulfatase B
MPTMTTALGALMLGALPAPDGYASKPNLVFFMADDLGWNNVQWHNPTQMKTPNGAALVREGIELDRHYAFLYCSPSRSAFMTGRMPYHVQQENHQNCDLGQGAPRNMTFIAAKLKQAGYQTHHIGKVRS